MKRPFVLERPDGTAERVEANYLATHIPHLYNRIEDGKRVSAPICVGCGRVEYTSKGGKRFIVYGHHTREMDKPEGVNMTHGIGRSKECVYSAWPPDALKTLLEGVDVSKLPDSCLENEGTAELVRELHNERLFDAMNTYLNNERSSQSIPNPGQ
jgi:hypothetical protein